MCRPPRTLTGLAIYGDVSISKTEPDKQQDQQRNAQEVRMPAKSYPKAEPNLPGASIFPKDNLFQDS